MTCIIDVGHTGNVALRGPLVRGSEADSSLHLSICMVWGPQNDWGVRDEEAL